MKRVLVTGATGFVGRHCLPLLCHDNYEVHGVYHRDISHLDEVPAHVIWHQANLLDFNQLSQLISSVKPTHLLHLAWYVEPGKYWTAPENIRWTQASLYLLETFAQNKGQRIVIAGTCAEYDWRYGYCSEQITPLVPTTLYGTCKHSLQMVVSKFADQTDLSAAWGRIFHLYGPHEHPQRLVAAVIQSLLDNKVARCSSGEQVRDFLHVQDAASAFVALLNSDVSGPVNIASGCGVTLKDVIITIGKILNQVHLIQLGALPLNEGEPPLLIADVTRLQKEVGWKPKYSLDNGIQQTIEWWQLYREEQRQK